MDVIDEGKANRHVAVTSESHTVDPHDVPTLTLSDTCQTQCQIFLSQFEYNNIKVRGGQGEKCTSGTSGFNEYIYEIMRFHVRNLSSPHFVL